MQKDALLTLVIPAYNEAESLSKFLGELLDLCEQKDWKIVIVNDGSRDATRQVLAGFENRAVLEVVHHKVNRGYGGALKSGLRQVKTKYCVTLDADGQHDLGDVENMFQTIVREEADLIVGNRRGNKASGWYRELGKSIIRRVAKMMMPLKIYDINSGLKMYDTQLVQKYLQLCPDSMAFSDVITLTFVFQRNLVLEVPVKINKRVAGKSTIGARTAFDTVMEIINIVTLFNPLRIFLPLSLTCILVSIIWEAPILLKGLGISIGALFGFMTGIIFFLLGLLAEQLGNIRRLKINPD
jgi:glycosyltransferase involved in cell wall biosynthesis